MALIGFWRGDRFNVLGVAVYRPQNKGYGAGRLNP